MTTIVALHAYGAQWQELELILRERRERVVNASLRPAETFMCACRRPTEAACFRVRKGANKSQLIVAGVQRFLQYAYAAHRIDTQNAVCAT